jgi:cytochrome c oxidase accessory protein FixG
MSDFVPVSALRSDGKRSIVHPADVKGPWTRRRRIVFAILILIYLSLPFIEINGHPAVFLDIPKRHFYLFGGAFNAQDIWLMFFLLSGIGFSLFFITAVAGRIWCGYACPQTVFLEGVYRRIERLIEGPRSARLRLDKRDWDGFKLARKLIKHALYLVVTLVIVHVFLSYFVSMPSLFDMIRHNPGQHPTAFGFMAVTTLLMYANFAWFREQLCLIICPYGRLQSVMTDSDTLIIGYDESRGEPRGKKTDPNAGDCIDCKRCVAVCPTGIDIRNGLQVDCIGCAACIDACDEIMEKVGRPKGLVRYDSLNGLAGKAKRLLRPRIGFYIVLGIAGLIAATLGARAHTSYEVNLLRHKGLPYVFDKSTSSIRNNFHLNLVNKNEEKVTYALSNADTNSPIELVLTEKSITLDSMATGQVQVLAIIKESAMRKGLKVRVRITPSNGDPPRTATAPFLGP